MWLAWRDDLKRKAKASWQNALVYIRGASKSDIDQSCDEHSSYADCDDCQSCHELLFSPQVFGISLSGKLWAALHVMCKIQEL
jgi:hypothetical protein